MYNRGYTKQITSEQEQTLSRERDQFRSFGFDSPDTYLGANFTGFRNVPLYKIARQARADAFKDLDTKGFAFAYQHCHVAVRDQWSDKFDLYQMATYIENYRQVVMGFFMTMGD